ncbi:MAG: hypothetical protein MOGMAGMI_00109 [Candidatus Omnitrophica bacterium]|nr:hypothetical protein [Candidatus Omnitrophota bacterium]
MTESPTGLLIYFDETARLAHIENCGQFETTFTDTFSDKDWGFRKRDVVGIVYPDNIIRFWALAEKGGKVATAKVRIKFTHIKATEISIDDLGISLPNKLRSHYVRASRGAGGRIPVATWQALKKALREIDHDSYQAILELERLRDSAGQIISSRGLETLVQQRDAVGVALDIFDPTQRCRKDVVSNWTMPPGDMGRSFLDGLGKVRCIEDNLISSDANAFGRSDSTRNMVGGVIIAVGGRKLETFNVNRTAIEQSLGVDLIYWNEAFQSWVLVQYKIAEDDTETRGKHYRPDAGFREQLSRMREFRAKHPDLWTPSAGNLNYRLCGDGFFFKFCTRMQLVVMSERLTPGFYVPRLLVESYLTEQSSLGSKGGELIKFTSESRWISNSLFTQLVADSWIGTRGATTQVISEIIRRSLAAGRSVVMCRARPESAQANLSETIDELGLRS